MCRNGFRWISVLLVIISLTSTGCQSFEKSKPASGALPSPFFECRWQRWLFKLWIVNKAPERTERPFHQTAGVASFRFGIHLAKS